VIERYALIAVLGYLLGSLPFGLYVARFANERLNLPASFTPPGNVAPRDLYLRPGAGPRLAGVAFVLELLKGFLPTLGGYMALGVPGALSGGSAALVGHGFPLFARFRASSSLAPLWGVLLALYPLVVVILAMVWTAALAAWRYVSLAALATAAISPLALAALGVGAPYEELTVWVSVGWSALIFFTHRGSVVRLVGGREPRLGETEAGRGGNRGRRRVR
jgi:glycerol-3-phosphate acyltransferase PlsY